MKIEDLTGLTLVKVTVNKENEENEQIEFVSDCGRIFRMFHDQDCCESVYIESITGDILDLIGSPILISQESCSDNTTHYDEDKDKDKYKNKYISYTWTFYKFATIKGYVDIRWFGGSNGCYSERVEFEEVTPSLQPPEEKS